MPHELTHSEDLVRIRFTGTVTVPDLSAMARGLLQRESESAITPHRLVDFRACTGVQLDFGAVYELAQQRNATAVSNPVKSAVVAPEPIMFGFARLYQMLITNPGILVAIFPTEEAALAWLRAPGFEPPAMRWSPAEPTPPDGG